MFQSKICVLLILYTFPKVAALRLAYQSQNYDNESDDNVAVPQKFTDVNTYNFEQSMKGDHVPFKLQGGLAFIKAHKVGGSTWGGVMRRIGNRYGLNHVRDENWLEKDLKNHRQPGPSVWANHGHRDKLKQQLRKLMPNAVYITLIRNPINTEMSKFYFASVSRNGKPATVKAKVQYLNKARNDNLNSWISPDPQNLSPAKVLASYSLVGVCERFDESLLLLGQHLGLNKTDLLYLKAKEAGHASTDKHDQGQVMAEHPPFSSEPLEVQKAGEHLQNGTDAQLHLLANKALDKAISEYGTGFQTDLKEFQNMLLEVKNACQEHFSEGCLWNDNGCAQDCIDQYAQKHEWH